MADLAGHDWTSSTNGIMTVSASGYHATLDPFNACDNMLGVGNYWLNTAGEGSAGWWKIDFGEAVEVGTVELQANTIPEGDRMPKDFTIQGSANDSDWDTLDTVAGETGWSSGEKRTFAIDSPAAYRYYKIDVTDNNGGGQVQIGEIYFLEAEDTSVTVAENVNVTSEFDDNLPIISEAASVLSEFDYFAPNVDISESVNVTSEFDDNMPGVDEAVSVNSAFTASQLVEISEGISANAEFSAAQAVEMSEGVSVETEFVGYVPIRTETNLLTVTLPLITAEIHGQQGGFLNATLPMITADIESGALLNVTLPMITSEVEGTAGHLGRLDGTLPMITAAIDGDPEIAGDLDETLSMILAYFSGKAGQIGNLDEAIPMIVAEIQGFNDLTGEIDAILPMIKPYMVGTPDRFTGCNVLRYEDTYDCMGDLTVELPMITASITEA